MNRILPKYASEFTDRHGKTRIRLRRQGWSAVYINAEPGTPEFTQAYKEWEASGKIEIGIAKVKQGSFDDLISRFYRSPQWRDLKESTQDTYRNTLERFRSKYGERTVATMTAGHVSNLVSKMADTPGAANNLRKRLNQLFKFAIVLGWRKDNPVAAVSGLKTKEGGFQTWQEEQIAQFEARWPIGTMPRLAFDLALYTAQRRSDLRLMGPQHVESGKIRVKQLKTGKTLLIPIHPNLAKSIAATKSGHLAFLMTQYGAPFAKAGFGMWFMRRCRDAGVIGYPLHGLRKAASRRMAETGLSNQLIKAITGHVTDSEVSRYTREAEQVRMAEIAMNAMVLANRQSPDLSNPDESAVNKGI